MIWLLPVSRSGCFSDCFDERRSSSQHVFVFHYN